jgi:cyclase
MNFFFEFRNIKRYSNIIKFTITLSSYILVFCILFFINNISSIEAQKFKDVEIAINQLTNGTYMLVGKGGNIGLSIGNDGVLLIDSQFEQLTKKFFLQLIALPINQ